MYTYFAQKSLSLWLASVYPWMFIISIYKDFSLFVPLLSIQRIKLFLCKLQGFIISKIKSFHFHSFFTIQPASFKWLTKAEWIHSMGLSSYSWLLFVSFHREYGPINACCTLMISLFNKGVIIFSMSNINNLELHWASEL